MISKWLGSWPGIVGVWAFCGAWMLALGPVVGWQPALNALTLALSVVALTFTQLVLREQARDMRRQDNMLREVVHALPDADDQACEDVQS